MKTIDAADLSHVVGGIQWPRPEGFTCKNVPNVSNPNYPVSRIQQAVKGETRRNMRDGAVLDASRAIQGGQNLRQICNDQVNMVD